MADSRDGNRCSSPATTSQMATAAGEALIGRWPSQRRPRKADALQPSGLPLAAVGALGEAMPDRHRAQRARSGAHPYMTLLRRRKARPPYCTACTPSSVSASQGPASRDLALHPPAWRLLLRSGRTPGRPGLADCPRIAFKPDLASPAQGCPCPPAQAPKVSRWSAPPSGEFGAASRRHCDATTFALGNQDAACARWLRGLSRGDSTGHSTGR